MDIKNSFINEIVRRPIVREIPIYPIQNKYLRYNQINEFLVPTMCKFENMTVEVLQENIRSIYKEHELLRAIFSKKDDTTMVIRIFEHNESMNIPLYTVNSSEEMNKLLEILILDLIEREIQENVLYNICFVNFNNVVYFYGVFNHLIFDGSFDFEKYLMNPDQLPKSTLPIFEEYLNNVNNYCNTDFELYLEQKDKFLEKYLSSNVLSYSFDFNANLFNKKDKITIEEFWILVVYRTLFRVFDKINTIPLNVLTNGRKFSNVLFSKDFGDFHDEIILMEKAEDINERLINKYREYRKNPYSNSRAYSDILTQKNLKFVDMEPFILVVAGYVSKESDNYQKLKESLPEFIRNNRKYVITMRVNTKSNLRDFNIVVRYSPKLKDKIELFKKIMDEEANNVLNQLSIGKN